MRTRLIDPLRSQRGQALIEMAMVVTLLVTLSIGIAIYHHLEPLNDALELARNAEKIAKKVDGKNALAITLSKRGSGDRTITGSWSKSGSR